MFLTVHISRIDTAYAGRHREQLPQCDFRLAWIVERKYLGRQVFRREDLLIETVRDEVGFLLQHDADRDAGESIPTGSQFGLSLTISAAEISFIDKPSVAHDQQPAVLAGLLDVLKRVIELLSIGAGQGANLDNPGYEGPPVARRPVTTGG